MLRAEWEHVSRPERIEALADKFLDLQQPSLSQIVRDRGSARQGAKVDAIGRKLDALGVADADQYAA